MCPGVKEGALDLHEVQALADLVKNSNLHELEIERGNMRLKIVNATCQIEGNSGQPTVQERQAPRHRVEEDASLHVIKSPIVGTFYGAPSPGTPDFVAKGDRVDANSIVCIIEAMKVMNEIQAEVGGVVTDILAQNGQPVEFGQPLFRVKKI
jgi:acetyl-CoA carboxylase biotin carboxyl carrier protein